MLKLVTQLNSKNIYCCLSDQNIEAMDFAIIV